MDVKKSAECFEADASKSDSMSHPETSGDAQASSSSNIEASKSIATDESDNTQPSYSSKVPSSSSQTETGEAKTKTYHIDFSGSSYNSEPSCSYTISASHAAILDKRLGTEIEFVQPHHMKFGTPANPQLYRMRNPDNNSLPGYNPFRGDFEIEYDNSAEEKLLLAAEFNKMTSGPSRKFYKKEDRRLFRGLQYALFQSYNDTLRERNRRKQILKEHGLLNQLGWQTVNNRLEKNLGKTQVKKLACLCKIASPYKADLMCASLDTLNDQRAKLNKLMYYRAQHGITTHNSMQLFESQRKEREVPTERVELRKIIDSSTVKRKRQFKEMYHYPRYKELSVKEADLCSSINILPEFFLETKSSLMSDCKKNNGMLLKRARKLVKIDVNKTRKIYDLLMEEGTIWPLAPEETVTSVVEENKDTLEEEETRSIRQNLSHSASKNPDELEVEVKKEIKVEYTEDTDQQHLIPASTDPIQALVKQETEETEVASKSQDLNVSVLSVKEEPEELGSDYASVMSVKEEPEEIGFDYASVMSVKEEPEELGSDYASVMSVKEEPEEIGFDYASVMSVKEEPEELGSDYIDCSSSVTIKMENEDMPETME